MDFAWGIYISKSASMTTTWLAFDIGTSGTKAAVMRPSYRVCDVALQ